MGGPTSAAHWWEEWQMRVLVLSSLLVQFLLPMFSTMRRLAIPGWLRLMVRLAYLASDALAIYALGTLFNRHKDQDRGGSNTLEVIWAPVLLIHLGGNDHFTAYSIEDNERWSVHLYTAVAQVILAIYVFFKSWHGGDKRLLQAAILLFVVGIVKCFVRPWALKRASINSLIRSRPAERTARQYKDEMHPHPLEEYVRSAKAFVQNLKDEGVFEDDEAKNKLFFDLSSPYPSRLIFKQFWLLSEERAYRIVRRGLASAFLSLYTKLKAPRSLWVELTRMLLPWAAIGFFHQSHKQAYNDIDVKITYAVFCCSAMLETYSTMNSEFHTLPEISALVDSSGAGASIQSNEEWPEKIAQYNLIGYVTRNRKHRKWIWIVSLFGCKDFLDQYWCMKPCFLSGKITKLVLQYLKDGWENKIEDTASYRRFNDNRGHSALEGYEHLLGWSIKVPFDESVLLYMAHRH